MIKLSFTLYFLTDLSDQNLYFYVKLPIELIYKFEKIIVFIGIIFIRLAT